MVNKPIVGVAVLIFVLAAAGLLYLRNRSAPLPAAPTAPVAATPEAAEPGISHPLPAAAGSTGSGAPLPDLADSDAPLRDALAQISSADVVKDFLVPQDLIRKMVVTIDNLPRQKVAVDKRPTTADTRFIRGHGRRAAFDTSMRAISSATNRWLR